MKKRWTGKGWPACCLLLLSAALLLLPVSAEAADGYGRVHVTVENRTYPKANGAAWEGELVNTWVELNEKSTMMSCIREALGSIPSEGADGTYISSINDLSEFDGGSESGWMGTLNDWFVNEGFHEFKVSEKELFDGDEIHVMYTCSLGVDLGGSWEDNDKRLKTLSFSEGALTPAFSSDTYSYELEIETEEVSLVVTPEAKNKQYQVRTSVDSITYRRPETIRVKPGDVITVKVGDPSWPGMSGDDSPAKEYTVLLVEKKEPEPEPEPPADPVLTGVKNTASGITFSFKASEGADLYRIYRKTGSGSWAKVKDQTGTTYTDTNVISGTTYTYTARARGNGLWSSYDKTGVGITWLSQPAVKLANKATGVTVSWDAVKGASGYIIYRKTGSGSWAKLGTVTGKSYTDTTAKSGTTYYYTSKAYKGKTYSTYDTRKKILRLAQPKVTAVKVTGGIKASWAKITGADSYIVYRKTGSGSWVKLGTVTGVSYTDKTAKTGTTYYYTAKAAKGTTYSSYAASNAIRR